MKYAVSFVLLCVALFLETTILHMPFVLAAVVFLTVILQEQSVVFFAFIFGILLDMLSFRSIGISSLFFVLCLGVLFLYQRKFEIESIPFVAVFTFLTVVVYGMVFGYMSVFLGAFFLAFLSAVALFSLSKGTKGTGRGKQIQKTTFN